MLKSKIHRATLTGCELNYAGSITIDEALLEKADLLPGEQVQVLNLNTGGRFITYTMTAPRGSGTVLLNGPAARLGMPGDQVLVISYCQIDAKDARQHKPIIVHVDGKNRPIDKQ